MKRDAAILAILVVAFATLLTVHIAIALGLERRTYLRRALIAFMVAPLAPWWGWREKMHVRGLLWVTAAVVYAAALWLALH
jgi:hypothetical protein